MVFAAALMSGRTLGVYWILKEEIAGDDNKDSSAQGKPNNQILIKVQCGSKKPHNGPVPRKEGKVKESCCHNFRTMNEANKMMPRNLTRNNYV